MLTNDSPGISNANRKYVISKTKTKKHCWERKFYLESEKQILMTGSDNFRHFFVYYFSLLGRLVFSSSLFVYLKEVENLSLHPNYEVKKMSF